MEVAYLAGLFDGEGHACLQDRHKYGGLKPQLKVSVTNTELELLSAFQTFTGRGTICGPYFYQRTGQKKSSYTWQITGQVALIFLRKVYPFLRSPSKRKRIEEILRSGLTWKDRGPYRRRP